MKAQRKKPEDFTNLSARIPQELHVRVQQEMLARDGTINFTQLILGFFERYVAAEGDDNQTFSHTPQNSTFSTSTDGQMLTPYDVLLQIDQEAIGHLDVLMACLVERARERQRLESKLSIPKEAPHKGPVPGKKRSA